MKEKTMCEMAPKRILVISQYFYPESFRINDICQEWINRGYDVTVVTGIPNYPQGHFYKGYGLFQRRRENYNGIQVIRIPIVSRGKSVIRLVLNYMSFVISGGIWQLFTHIKCDKVFIFEVSPMTQALVGIWYTKIRKVPCYLYVQDLWPENVEVVAGLNNKLIIGIIDKMVNYIYRNCTKILTTSPSFVKKIRSRKCVEKSKVIYWPQYAEDFYKPFVKSMSATENILMFTGNIGYAQGLDILPKAAKILKRRGVDCKIKIIGEGRYKKELEEIIEKMHVVEWFEFCGKKLPEEIPECLADAKFAFLSFADNDLFANTIPAKLQSYMACGKPIIGAVSGESERIIKEANCGWVVPMGNEEKLADIIALAIDSSEEERQRMSRNALCYYKMHFGKNDLMNQLEIIWEEDKNYELAKKRVSGMH